MQYIIAEYAQDAPPIIREYLNHFTVVRGRSSSTAREYFLDLRLFFRFLLIQRGFFPRTTPFDEISIKTVDIDLIRSVQLNDVYDFLSYIATSRPKHGKSAASALGVNTRARARKVSALRSFYKYLHSSVHLLDTNPLSDLEVNIREQSLPVHLTQNEAIRLLEAVDGPYATRDYCILTLFLNCGLRVSELVGMNLGDVRENVLRVVGKGNKERIVYLNQACLDAIEAYMPARIVPHDMDKYAFFISKKRNRINVQTVKWLVKKHLAHADLDTTKLSVHKLRHTAATLMYQNGVDIRTLQTMLGHSNLDTTTIYTHIVHEDLARAADQIPLATVKMSKKLKKVADEVANESARGIADNTPPAPTTSDQTDTVPTTEAASGATSPDDSN